MGQYFMWINPVKGEYMEPIDFGHGSKRTESSFVGDKILNVLYTLIDSDWKDDSIIWIGDEECRLHNETNPALKLAEQICGETPYDYALDHFTDVSCQFSCAHKENVITGFFHENVFKRINLEEHYIEKWFEVDDIIDGEKIYRCRYCDNFSDFVYFLTIYMPEKGMFTRWTKKYRFIINKTKKEYIDTDAIPENRYGSRYNTFPELMAKYDNSEYPLVQENDSFSGLWLGDRISVSNDPVEIGNDYKEVSNIYTWEKL